MRTLLSPEGSGAQYDPMEALYEIYPGSLANLYGAASTVDTYFVDYDFLTRGQQVAFLILDKMPIAVVGAAKKLDGPYDSTMAITAAGMATLVAGGPSATAIALGSGAYAMKIMFHCDSMDVVLYGLQRIAPTMPSGKFPPARTFRQRGSRKAHHPGTPPAVTPRRRAAPRPASGHSPSPRGR